MPDTLRMRPIAVGDQRESLAIATRSVLHGAGESWHCERTGRRRRGAEVTRLSLREVEIDGEADRSGEIDADLAASEINPSNIDRCAQPFRSITVPQRVQVRRARFE